MPLRSPQDFGTERGGAPAPEYCRFCYVAGAFVQPEMSMQAMLDQCVRILVEQRMMPADQAQTLMRETLPRLKRWRTAPATGVLVV
jgi:hypothetical protein